MFSRCQLLLLLFLFSVQPTVGCLLLYVLNVGIGGLSTKRFIFVELALCITGSLDKRNDKRELLVVSFDVNPQKSEI